MNTDERKIADIATQEFLDSMLKIYSFDQDDDRDLCLDAIMMWLYENFGKGEVMEYIAISLSGGNVDEQQSANHLYKSIEAIGEQDSDFNLFGENASRLDTEQFAKHWKLFKEHRLSFMESLRDLAKQKLGRDVIFDILTIWIASEYGIEEDLENMLKKYFGKQAEKKSFLQDFFGRNKD